MTKQFREENLIVDEDVSHYDGTTAVVGTRHIAADEVEYLRWRAERWMKVKHVRQVFPHAPWFVVRYTPAMLRYTFTGSSLRSMIGLEHSRTVFARYRNARRQARNYLRRA
jgi:hypothetical protein